MVEATYRDAALILVAHGSSSNTGSAAPTYQHAGELRRRAIFAEVTEAFLKQDPPLSEALQRVQSPRVFVVPLFISDGWTSEEVVPIALGLRATDAQGFERVQSRGSQIIYYCRAIGSHPSMTAVLLSRAKEVVTRHAFPSVPRPGVTALLIAGHGTSYSPGSRTAIENQVQVLLQRAEYAEVHGVFLEEPPFVRDCWELTRSRNLVLVPFFISDGLHTQEDIPVMLGEAPEAVRERLQAGLPGWRNPTERHHKRLWCARAVGTEPHVVEIILERVREAASGLSAE